MTEFSDYINSQETQKANKVNLLNSFERKVFPHSISVDSKLIGQEKWNKMLEETEKDGIERGIFISSDEKGRSYLSKIFKGTSEIIKNGEVVERPSFNLRAKEESIIDLFFSPISFLNQQDIVVVHTHPKKYLIFSEYDICAFAQSEYNALVMLNNLGVHLLIGQHSQLNLDEVAEKYQELKNKNISDLSKVKEMGEYISKFNLGYYFSNDLKKVDLEKNFIHTSRLE